MGFLFERHADLGQSAAHLLEVAETGADAGTAQFDGEADLANADAVGDVVGLDLFGAAARNAGGFMGHARIGESAAHHPRPFQLVGLKGGGGADIRLRLKADAEIGQGPADKAHGRGRQHFLAQPVVAGIAFHALVAVDRGALELGIDIDCAHRADIGAVAAGDALLGIDLHCISFPEKTFPWQGISPLGGIRRTPLRKCKPFPGFGFKGGRCCEPVATRAAEIASFMFLY